MVNESEPTVIKLRKKKKSSIAAGTKVRIVVGLCFLCWHRQKSRSTGVKEGPKDTKLVSSQEHGKPHAHFICLRKINSP
jgi:hypothetical protein